ncbi:hypothetical protein THAOC_36382, partial [Thalassiosira oceanica]
MANHPIMTLSASAPPARPVDRPIRPPGFVKLPREAEPMPSLFAGDDDEEDAKPCYRDDPLASPPPSATLECAAAESGDPASGEMTPLPRHGLRRRACLLLPLLLTLYSLTDTDRDGAPPGGRGGRHLAFVTALSRHPPSMRIFRLVFEGVFLLYCGAFALRVWEGSYRRVGAADGSGELERSDGTFGDPTLGTVGNGLGGGGFQQHEVGPKAVMTPEAVGGCCSCPRPTRWGATPPTPR